MRPAIMRQEPSNDQVGRVERFLIEPTNITPLIYYNEELNQLEFRGKSSPENAPGFYQQIHEWFDHESFKSMKSLTVEMSMAYFNTSSCKCLFMIFKKLNQFKMDGMNMAVNWYYEEYDDDMMEAGEDFSEIFDMEFNLIEIEE